MKRGDVDELSDEERGDRASNRPHALPKDRGECCLHVLYAAFLIYGDPELRGRQRDREVSSTKRIRDERDREPRNEAHAALPKVLVDDVREEEDERPEQYAARERQRTRLTEEIPIQR